MPAQVCLVALNAYPVIDPEIPGPIGGVETRSWLLAKGLSRQPDMDVHFAVRHSRPLRRQNYDGVQLHLKLDRLYQHRESLALRLRRVSGFPWIQLNAPRWDDAVFLPAIVWERFWRGRPDPLSAPPFFKNLPADVFLTFGVQRNSASVIAAAHATGRPAVLFLGSDSDLDDRYLSEQEFISTYQDSASVCRWTIQNADWILCQTPAQQAKLKQFGRDATLLRNPIDFESWESGRNRSLSIQATAGLDRYALWVGRAENVHKQPLQLLEVARKCPQVDFLMILNRRDDAVEAEVRRTAPVNVKIVERIPFADMPAVMQRAAVLVNTSSLEGFPNTYLQAAATGVPVASLNVESEFLQASRAGSCANGQLHELARVVQSCWAGSPPEFDPLHARRFIEEHHSLSRQTAQLAEVLKQVIRKS